MLNRLQALVRRLWAGANAYPASLPGGFPFAGPLTRFANAVNRLRAIVFMVFLLAGPVLIPLIMYKAYTEMRSSQALGARGVRAMATVLEVSKVPSSRAQRTSDTFLVKYAFTAPGPDGRAVRYTGSYKQSVSRGSTVDPREISILFDPENPLSSTLNRAYAHRAAQRSRIAIFMWSGLWLLLFAGVYFGGRERKTKAPSPAAA